MTRISAFAGSAGATLTVSLTESLTIDNRDYGGKQTMTFSSISDVYKRILTAITIEQDLMDFGAIAKAGVMDVDDVRYMRISNIDDTHYCKLTFHNTGGDEFMITLDKGQSFVWCGDMATGVNNFFAANQGELQFQDATCDYTGSSTTVACDASKLIKVGQTVTSSGGAGTKTITAVNTPGAVTSFTIDSAAVGSTPNENSTFTINQTSGLTDLSKITCQSDTANVDLEVYIASV